MFNYWDHMWAMFRELRELRQKTRVCANVTVNQSGDSLRDMLATQTSMSTAPDKRCEKIKLASPYKANLVIFQGIEWELEKESG